MALIARYIDIARGKINSTA